MSETVSAPTDRSGMPSQDINLDRARAEHQARADCGREQAAEPLPPTAAEKLVAVLAVLSRRASCAQAASRCDVAEAEVESWRQLFIDSGRRGLSMFGGLGLQSSDANLSDQNEALKSALHDRLAELASYRRIADGKLGPFAQVEEIRRLSEISISRFCTLIGVSRRTYFRHLALIESTQPPKNESGSSSIMSTCAQLVERYMAEHPSYGYRRIHELMIADGHVVSASTVLRAMHLARCRTAVAAAQEVFD